MLIHGFPLDTRRGNDQCEVCAQHDQMLRADVRGYGKSALPTSVLSDHSDDLNALMQHCGIDSAHILGFSMGGRNAINFALTYPDAIDTLIAGDTGLDG